MPESIKKHYICLFRSRARRYMEALITVDGVMTDIDISNRLGFMERFFINNE